MRLTTGQAYWYISGLLKTGMIHKLKATEYVGNKGKQQAMYKVKPPNLHLLVYMKSIIWIMTLITINSLIVIA